MSWNWMKSIWNNSRSSTSSWSTNFNMNSLTSWKVSLCCKHAVRTYWPTPEKIKLSSLPSSATRIIYTKQRKRINLTRIRFSLIYDLSSNFLNLMHCCVPLGHPWATCVHADPPARQWAVRDLRSCAQNRDLQCQRLHHPHGLSTLRDPIVTCSDRA